MHSNLETQTFPNQTPDSSSSTSLILSDGTDDSNSNFKFSQNLLLNRLNKIELLNYFANNISDIMDLAFNDTETDDGKKAFLILSNGPQLIIDSLTKDFRFFLKVTEILQNPQQLSNKLNACTIQRISTTFNYLILKDVQFSIDSIGFITQLLPYVEEDAVYELFHTIFTTKTQLKMMRNLLSDIDIDTFIINELKNSPTNTSCSQFNTYAKKLNLLLIIHDGLLCEQLKNSFHNFKVLSTLSSMIIETKEPLLLNQIWSSLALLVSQELIQDMKDAFTKAIKMISTSFEKLHSYHASIFDFLGNIVDINASMFTASQKKQICHTFQNLSLKYPNSTHLQSSMYNFIRKSLHNREFAQRILDNYISFFIDQGTSQIRTAASANSLVFLADLDSMKTSSYMISKSLSNNRKYIEFHRTFFKKYLEELHKPYGGNIQICYSRK